MKRTIGLSVALMIGCATGTVVRDLVAPARAQNQVGPSYEYSTVVLNKYSDADVIKATTEYGKNGWRLAATLTHGQYDGYLIFERQLMR